LVSSERDMTQNSVDRIGRLQAGPKNLYRIVSQFDQGLHSLRLSNDPFIATVTV